MKESFKELIFSSFLKTYGPIIAFLGIIFAIISPYYGKFDVPVIWPLLIFLISLIFITTFLDVAYKSYKSIQNILPKVVSARKFPYNDEFTVQCLLEPSELFSHDSLVSFYYIEDDDEDFEELIGFGYVLNIQQNKKIQVVMYQSLESYKEIIEKLMGNNAKTLKKIRIKPHISKTQLEYLN